jgi:hypothetical protein
VLFVALKGKQAQGITALQLLVSARARELDSAQEDFNVTLNLFLGISQPVLAFGRRGQPPGWLVSLSAGATILQRGIGHIDSG